MKTYKANYVEAAKYACLENLQDVGSLGMGQVINLDYTGREECESGHSFGPYVRTSYLVHVVTKGRGIYQAQGKTYHISAGEAFVIFPGEETFYQADEEEPWTYCWVAFHGFLAKQYFENIGITPFHPVVKLTDIYQLEACVKNMLQASQLTYANELVRLGYLFSFLGFLEKNRKQEEVKEKRYQYSTHTYVQYAIDYIRYHYKEKIKIDGIAEYIGINRSYLTRNFKKEIGMSPQEFLIKFRMEKAAGLLKNSEEPVNLIANKVGYADQLAFSKAFKEQYGVSPQKYRAESSNVLYYPERRFQLEQVKL